MRSDVFVGCGFSIVLEKTGTWSWDCDIPLNPAVGMGMTIMQAITISRFYQNFIRDTPITFPLAKMDSFRTDELYTVYPIKYLHILLCIVPNDFLS
jgi:hypothetical protein